MEIRQQVTIGPVSGSGTTDDAARFQELHDCITAAMNRLHVPGVAVGILLDGYEHIASFGITNVNAVSPVTSGTLFQIGSITKTVTATAVMRLLEMGRVELDVPLRTYLPELRLADETVAARVTLRHLLTHTAGWEGDYLIFHDTGRGDDALARFIAKLADAPQLTPLGEVWSYNNAGFYLAGRVIEAVTGRPYEQTVEDLVLGPLGMHHSFFFPEDVMLHRFGVGHHVAGDTPTVAKPWPIPRNANPAGGITTCPADMLRYARFHMGSGTNAEGVHLLSRGALDAMQTPTREARGGQWMGLAWFIRDVEGVRLLSHGGGTNGQIALLLLAPERQFALVIMTNASCGGELTEDVGTWALEHYLGIVEPEPAHLARTPEELAAYTGRYISTLNIIELTLRDGMLLMQMIPTDQHPGEEPPPTPPPTPLAFYDDDKVVALEGPLSNASGEFLRHSDGSIAWLRLSGRLHQRE